MKVNVKQRWLTCCVAAALALGCSSELDEPAPGAGSPGAELPSPGTPNSGAPGEAPPPSLSGDAPGSESPPGTSAPPTSTDGSAGATPPVSASGYTPFVSGTPVHSRFVRLTHAQWENSVRDLLHLDAISGLSGSFEGDPPRGTFDNNERALEVTSTLWGDYQRAAEALAEAAAADAERRAAIIDGAASAEAFVRDFGLKAHRRPLSEAQQQAYLELYHSAGTFFPELDAETAGFRLVVEAMLQSPHFVYRAETAEVGEPLNSYETAAKLSFLLRNTTPDAELLAAAADDALASPAQVQAWAERMIDETAMREVMAGYNTKLFGTHRYDSIIKDTEVFPEFDTTKSPDLRRGSDLFLAHIFENDLGLRALLTSTTGFVNQTTAPLYGIDAPAGAEFAEVDLGPERPGLFTRVGFLAYNGTNTQPDPIHRGVDLNGRMLCVNLVAPPGELPQLPPFEPEQTNRERVAAFTEIEGTACATCHGTIINPLGFAFESYDALGRLRATDNGQPIDTSGTYGFASGLAEFDDAVELTELMAQNPQVHACYAKHLAEFTLGRDLAKPDLGLVTAVMDQSLASASIKQMMLTIVQDEAFLTRQEGTP